MESTLYLMKNVDLDPNYNYTIDFDTEQAQSAYFDSKISNVLEYDEGYSYIKFNEPIKVYQNIDELFGVNYLMFTNNNKTYYGFILNKKWVSETCTALEFKIDVMQTFMFDYSIDESFIDREHQDRYKKLTSAYAVPIYNREKEQLERGEQFICTDIENIDNDIPQVLKDNFSTQLESGQMQIFWAYIIASEPLMEKVYNKNNVQHTHSSTINNGIPTNAYGYVVPMVSQAGAYSSANSFTIKLVDSSKDEYEQFEEYGCIDPDRLKKLSQNTKILSINISRYAPFNYKVEKVQTQTAPPHYNYRFIPELESDLFGGIYIGKITYSDETFNGVFAFEYFTKDNFRTFEIKKHNYQIYYSGALSKDNLKSIDFEPKLNTTDYKYYELSFGNQNLKLNIEDFDFVNSAQIKVLSSFSVKNGKAIIPLNYKGMKEAYTDMMTYDSTINELPLKTDAWEQYLAQNKNSMITGFTTNAIQSGLGLALGIATGGIGLAVAGTQVLNYAGQVANQMAQIKDIKATPDKVEKTTIDAILDHTIDDVYIKVNTYEIHNDFKNKIFNYFYHFGYKCNNFKKPNVRSRYYFNYIKTIGANIKTNIDADYKAEIMQIYDAGITIWHYRNKETFKGVNNYDYENVEMNLI